MYVCVCEEVLCPFVHVHVQCGEGLCVCMFVGGGSVRACVCGLGQAKSSHLLCNEEYIYLYIIY